MRRTTVTVPDELSLILDRETRRRNLSISVLVSEALRVYFRLTQMESKPRRLPIAGLGRSGRRHTARGAEKILRAKWGPRSRSLKGLVIDDIASEPGRPRVPAITAAAGLGEQLRV